MIPLVIFGGLVLALILASFLFSIAAIRKVILWDVVGRPGAKLQRIVKD